MIYQIVRLLDQQLEVLQRDVPEERKEASILTWTSVLNDDSVYAEKQREPT